MGRWTARILSLSLMKHSAMTQFLSNLQASSNEHVKNIISALFAESHTEHFAIHTTVIKESDASNDCGYVILSGSAYVYMEDEKIATLGIGEIFGEYAPIFQRNRTATVIAATDLTCLVIKK